MVMTFRSRSTDLPATMTAASFKARCLELMDAVARSGRSIVVTKRGRPIAMLAPVRTPQRSAFGFMRSRMQIRGDVMKPIDVAWTAER